MKKYIVLLFWGTSLILNAQVLQVPDVKQEKKFWCAAAVIECVLKHNKIDIGQCDIMNYVKDIAIYPEDYGAICCPEPPSNLPYKCNQGMPLGYDYENVSINNVLMHYGNTGNNILFSSAAKGVLPLASISTQLSSFWQPIIAGWNLWNGSEWGSHAVVICGIENGDMIKYMNPSEGIKRSLPYEKFKKDNNHDWAGYIVTSSPYPWHCFDCEQNYGEDGIDCGEGGGCRPCNAPPLNHCFNGIPDEDETGTDCGGADCPPCPAANCTNCILDPGEDMVDCGGTCPPCMHVGNLAHEITITSTAQLTSEMKAYKKITVGGATTVASGKNVTFTTDKTGSIVLLPGFKAEEGSNFSAQMQDYSAYSRFCGAICHDYILLPGFTRPPEELYIYNLNYAVEIRCDIYKSTGEYLCSMIHQNIDHNGDFYLWDGLGGTEYNGSNVPTGRKYYKMKYSIAYCNGAGNLSGKEHNFYVDYDYERSLPADPDTPETPPQFSPPPSNDTPSATTTPNLVIIPNPNNGSFNIETNFPLTDIGNLKITNLMGATVYETQKVTSNTVQLQNPTAGTFFVVMILKDGAVLTRKMVVQ